MTETTAVASDLQEPNDFWWVPLTGGILAVLFGLMLLTHPAETSKWVAFLVGFYWLASGVINLVSLFTDRTMWGWKLFGGIVGVLAGLLVIDIMSKKPLLATIGLATAYVFVLGIQGVVIGIIEIVKAFKGAGWGTGLLGVLSVFLGLLLMYNPLAGAVALPLVFGILAVVFGGAAIFMAYKVRKSA